MTLQIASNVTLILAYLSIDSLYQHPTHPNSLAGHFSVLVVLCSITFAFSILEATHVFLTIFESEYARSMSGVVLNFSYVDVCRGVHNLGVTSQPSVFPNSKDHPSIRQLSKALAIQGVSGRPFLLDADPLATGEPVDGTSPGYQLAVVQSLRVLGVDLVEAQSHLGLQGVAKFGLVCETRAYMLDGGGVGAVGLLTSFPIKVIDESKGQGVAQIFHEWEGGFCIIEIVVLELDYFTLHFFCFLLFIMLIMNARISSTPHLLPKKRIYKQSCKDSVKRVVLLSSKMRIKSDGGKEEGQKCLIVSFLFRLFQI